MSALVLAPTLAIAGKGSVEVVPTEFVPSSQDSKWTIDPLGLTGQGTFCARVHIPTGATARRFTIYVRDSDPNRDASAYLAKVKRDLEHMEQLAEVVTTGASTDERAFSQKTHPQFSTFGPGETASMCVRFPDDNNEGVSLLGAKVVYDE